MGQDFLKRLRLLSFTEGVSTLLLFGVAMPLKYLWDMPMAVRIVGMIHGALFSLLLIQLFRGVKRVPLAPEVAGLCMFAAIFPFGPFVADRWLKPVGEDKA